MHGLGSAVALSDRHRGAKNACASSRINRLGWNFLRSASKPQGEFRWKATLPSKDYLACVVRPVDCRHARDRSAVALSDRHRGAKKACASSRINRSGWNFPRLFFEPQGCLGPTFTHFGPKIGSGRAPGSFPNERKPTFPWPILTNKAPIESSGIQLGSWLVSIEIELDAKAVQASTRTQVDCAMLMYALLCTGFDMAAIFFLTSL